MTTNAQLQREVVRELSWDRRIPRQQITVEVDHEVVILQGTVEHWAQRFAAQEAAHRVPGVHDVVNDIVVRYPASLAHADAEIARLVRRELDRHSELPREQIHATVSAGWVGLTGSVDSDRQRMAAERIVRAINGVRGLTNEIEVHARLEAQTPAL